MPWAGPATSFAPVAIGAAILVACLLAALGQVLPRLVIDVLATTTAVGVAALDLALLLATRGGRVVSWLGGWTPSGGTSVGIVLVADPLGAGLALLAAVLVVAALVYSWRYFEDVRAHYHVLVLLFLAGMTGFALSGDVFDLFVFFELMGAVAYALTGFVIEEETAVHGALNFGIVNSLGAYLSLCGIGVLYARYGALSLPLLSEAMAGRPPDALVVTGFALLCTGLLVKAAVVPFHFWTADAEAVAPTPVCALFSGVMVALGVYGTFRVYWTAFSGTLPVGAVRPALLVLGVLTALVGAVMCVLQRHLKRLLAYSTIAHVGLFLTAAATLDAPGTAGAALYVLGHAGVKAALFLLTGIVLDRYGSVDEGALHGVGRPARLLPWFFLAGGLALAGLPPFGTGLGKAVSEEALAVAGLPFGPVLFVLVSGATGAAVLRAGGRIWFGWGRRLEDGGSGSGTHDPDRGEMPVPLRKVRFTLLAPAAALLAGALAIGVVPQVARGVGRAAERFLDREGYVAQALHGAAATPVQTLPEVGWTTPGVLLGLLSTALAAGGAALALWGPAPSRLARSAARPVAVALSGLRAVHSGRVGDYVAWLFLGVAVFAGLIGLQVV